MHRPSRRLRECHVRPSKTQTPRATSRANGDATRERILDAAEALFGERTFDTVSLRDITQKAGVTLALASYHFGSKEALFRETVARRAATLNQMRRERLAAVGTQAGVADILDAFMRPLFDQMRQARPGWPAYLLIISKLAQGDRWLNLLRDHFDDTARAFLDRLAEAMPDCPRDTLLRGFALSLDAMLQTLSKNRRVDSLSEGGVSADDLQAGYDVLLCFTVAGLEGLRLTAGARRF